MEIINLSRGGLESGLEGAVIAFGNFDGVHKGHQAIIEQIKARAAKQKVPAGILTFEPNPVEFLLKEKNYRITPYLQKMEILQKTGLDFVAYAEFTKEFSEMSPQDFVKKIFADKMKISTLLTGEDASFGHKAAGKIDLLTEMSKELGFEHIVLPKILDENGRRYSSRETRILIGAGKMEDVNAILGRDYEIEGIVEKGKQVGGKELSRPTANLNLDGYVLPLEGVYKTTVVIEGKEYLGAANIGGSPTYGDMRPVLEVNVLDFNDNIYGENIAVRLNSFIRPIKKFENKQELMKQIEKDVELIRKK